MPRQVKSKRPTEIPVHSSDKFYWIEDKKVGVTSIDHFMSLSDATSLDEVNFDLDGLMYIKSTQTNKEIEWVFDSRNTTKDMVCYQFSSGSLDMSNWHIEIYKSHAVLIKTFTNLIDYI